MELTILVICVAGAAVLTVPLVTVKRHFDLSKAKHRSLTGHARLCALARIVDPLLRL